MAFPATQEQTGSMPFLSFRSGDDADKDSTNNLLVTFAANDKARLYINGQQVSDISDWSGHKNYSGNYPPGTIVTLMAKNIDGWGGVVADIKYDGKHYVTGRDNFKAKKAFATLSENNQARSMALVGCSWRKPVPVQVLPHHTFSRSFPYKHGAQYIWARGTPSHSTIILRFVLGGEHCPAIMPSVSPTPLPSTRCSCKQSTGFTAGICYHFTHEEKDHHGLRKCRKRDCEIMYECVDSGATNTCIRKYASHEVRMIRRVGQDRFKCLLVSLVTPRVFLVPYA